MNKYIKYVVKLILNFYNLASGNSYSLEKKPIPRNPEFLKPVNQRVNLSNERSLDADVQYAFDVAKSYFQAVVDLRYDLREMDVLEIGPGVNLGTAYLLRSWGAKSVLAIDRFTHSWTEYQDSFYKKLVYKNKSCVLNLQILNNDIPTGFDWLSRHNINYLKKSLEDFEDGTFFDLVVSNATLEHLYQTRKAAENLFKLTNTGGIGVHQIDFRDHRDFARPLEYLLLDEIEFAQIFIESYGECGNRYRPHEIQEIFKRVGFKNIKLNPNMFAEDTYLTEFYKRVCENPACRAKYYSPQELRILSARLTMVK